MTSQFTTARGDNGLTDSNRRRFLQTTASAGAGLVTSLPSWATAAANSPSDLITVSVLHTTDLHGHIMPTETYDGVGDVGGLARCATQIRKWKKDNPNHLLLDIGDLYQGTHVSRACEGSIMVDLLNRMGYNGWVIGNHEFDWGPDPLFSAIEKSKMPVLSANLELGGKATGEFSEQGHAFSRITPWKMFEVAGMKIGVIGLTTPGLPYWLPEALRGGIGPLDPIELAKAGVADLQSQGANAILVTGHFGYKGSRDDYANPCRKLLKEVEGIDVFIGGHTHQDLPYVEYEDTLFTQAGYHGIYCGRLDMTFSREAGKLVDRRAMTVLMDSRFEFDPIVMDIAKDSLEQSDLDLAKPVGKLETKLTYGEDPDQASDIQDLVGAAVIDAAAQDGIELDGVLHGSFVDADVPAGSKTMADMWKLVPYENMLVVAHLNYSELVTIFEEASDSWYNNRRLVGFDVTVKKNQFRNWMVTQIRRADGSALHPTKRYAIAFNAYDAQSGGRRIERLRSIVRLKNSRSEFYEKLTRDALAEFFLRHETVDQKLIDDTIGRTPKPEKA